MRHFRRLLNALLDPTAGARWVLVEADAINDAGQITGLGVINGARHGFVLTPIYAQGRHDCGGD
jgi:hypothetical protein